MTAQHRDDVIPKEAAHDLLKTMGPYGVGCGWVSEQDGGLGLDFLTSGLLYEELSRVSPDLAGVAFVAEGAALKLARTGSTELKARYLPRLLSGELIGCSAISEPGIGSSVREMRTRAVRDGKNYRITGEKMWISNATIADIVIVVARTDESEFTMFLVDREAARLQAPSRSRQARAEWMVARSDHIRRRRGAGGKHDGRPRRWLARDHERVRALALLRLDAGARASRRRRSTQPSDIPASGTPFGKPIAGHQLVQGLLAAMATDVHAARLLVYRALWMMAQGARCEIEAAIAKSFATEAALRVASNAIQVHGAFGISREFAVERHFRDARMLTIPDGTTQINQLVIGRKLTGIDAFA